MKGVIIMIIKILPLILIFTISCSPLDLESEPQDIEVEESVDIKVEDEMEEDEAEEEIDNELVLDLNKSFTPKEYTLVEAYPALEFEQALLLTSPRDEIDKVYLVEKTGKIKYFNNDSAVENADIFLDLSSKVDSRASEKGLLGLAFHPNYKENGYFYVNYTDRDNTILARYSRMNGSELGDINSEEILLKIQQPYSNHNGGHLVFGPDGYLYMGTGDGGSGGDPQNNSQNRGNLLGKILRIDLDNSSDDKAYSIPDDNPFKGNTEGYREEIFAYGLRNPWKFSFDSMRDLLIAADVGQDRMEEINIIESGGNYGWNLMEGTLSYKDTNTSLELIPPIWEYEHPLGKSITGGYAYYGENNPSLFGVYIYGDFISGRIWGLWLDGDNNVENHELLDTDLMISSFGLDGKGEIYVVDFGGKIYTILEQ